MVVYARATVVTSGLVAHYNAANSSSYSGTGNRLNNLANTGFATLFNNPTYNASGIPFLSFNGINQHFFTENLTNFFPGAIGSKTNAISIFLWVYPTDAGVLVSEQGTASIDNFWYTSFIEITNVSGNSGTINCGTWSAPGIQSVSTGITLNQWNFIGFTHTGTTLTGYLNGVSFGTRNYARWSPFNHSANEYLTFGSGTTTNMGNGTYSNARFGQMGVYNRALTAAEMIQNYDAMQMPTTAGSNLTYSSVSSSSLLANWTNGNGSSRLVVCRPSSASVTNPTRLTNYTANASYGSGTALGSGFVVGSGTNSSLTITNLSPNTNYCLDIFEYNGSISSNTAIFLTSSFLTGCRTTLFSTPNIVSSNFNTVNITSSSWSANWTIGNGTNRIAICRPSSASATAPTNFSNYVANSTFGSGTQIGSGFVIGSGAINSVSITNLIANTNYCIDVYEYNGDLVAGTAIFNVSSFLTGCRKTSMNYPTIGSSLFTVNQNNPTSLSVSWTNGNGNARVVLVSANVAPNTNLMDATVYSANTIFGLGDTIGNAFVVYNANNNNFILSNLNPNTRYYFRVVEYTNNGSDPAYAHSISLLDSVMTIPEDTDNDGVIDVEDMFPTDAQRAFATVYPAAGFATLLFEDLWPSTGDYDFNDLVIDYQYTVISNADNNAVEATYKFVTRAIGGALHNGFAFQINGLNPNKISNITGTKTNGITWSSIGSNGTETGNTVHANIPVFKDAYDLLQTTGGHWFVNVETNAPDVGTDTTTVIINFLNNGVAPSGGVTDASLLGLSNFNPYIIVGQERGKEIHLVNMPPSQLMNMSYFGTINDGSVPASNIFYKSKQGLPWALNINQSIPYPIEKIDFISAFPNFVNWAISAGTTHTDWYLNNPGNRVLNKLIIR